MVNAAALLLAVALPHLVSADAAYQHALGNAATDKQRYRAACPSYSSYSASLHPPYSKGPLALPFQRPHKKCRTFESPLVEQVIDDMISRITDVDLARLFENAFPNTLDTTISWHDDGTSKKKTHISKHAAYSRSEWRGAQSFVVTGDITAEWLRDSTNQLQGYHALASNDAGLRALIVGAINTQAEFVIESPYCNAFQPPPGSRLPTTSNGQDDDVHPVYEPSFVFECKYELDSLAHFLRLANEYHKATGKTEFATERWFLAVEVLMDVVAAQSKPTFNTTTGAFQGNEYTFRRSTMTGTETLSLRGIGNPIAADTGLVRSAFRPSDDATILPFFIPANAMMAVELRRASEIVAATGGRSRKKLAEAMAERAERIDGGIRKHGIVPHARWGDVYAFEVDGYGGRILMDDANLPSLLALPVLGFVDAADPVYRNTREMILSAEGNPYFLRGSALSGIGGPHVGLHHAWPMSLLVQALTSDSDDEILRALNAVKNVSRLGLVHESVNVAKRADYTRSWFAWANSVFAQTVLHVAETRPHLLFGQGAKPYRLADVKVR